jgi:hypothetical protein
MISGNYSIFITILIIMCLFVKMITLSSKQINHKNHHEIQIKQ